MSEQVHSPDPAGAPWRRRQRAWTAKSEAAIGGRPIQTICVWTRLANVGAIARSIRIEVIGLCAHADAATATATATRHGRLVLIPRYPFAADYGTPAPDRARSRRCSTPCRRTRDRNTPAARTTHATRQRQT